MNKVIEYVIQAKDSTAAAVKSATERVKSFASGVGNQLANIKAGFDMAANVVSKFASVFSTAIKEAFKFEKVQSDFASLLNSVDAAKAHIEDLRKLASSTPLTFDDLSKASKLLLSFGMSVEEVMPSMKMLGDIAMGNSEKFQGLSLVFAQVKSAGKLMGQDLLQMINQGFNPLTIIAKETGKTMGELKDMMADGAISFDMVAEAMRVATSEGGLFNDAMANAAQTGEGLMSTLEDKWTDIVRTFGEAFTDSAKGGIQTLIDTLTSLVEDGSVDIWAKDIAAALNSVVEGATATAKALEPLVNVWKVIKGSYESFAQGAGNVFGTLSGGGSLLDALSAGIDGYKQGWVDSFDTDGAEAETNAAIKARAQARAKASSTDTSAKETVAKAEKQAQSLAQMVAKAEEKERIKAEKNIASERDKLMKQTVKTYTDQVSEWQKKQADAANRLAAAKENVSKALNFYEDDSAWDSYYNEMCEAETKRSEAMARYYEDLRSSETWRKLVGSGMTESDIARMNYMKDALNEQYAAEDYAKLCAEKVDDAVRQLEEMNQTLKDGGND